MTKVILVNLFWIFLCIEFYFLPPSFVFLFITTIVPLVSILTLFFIPFFTIRETAVLVQQNLKLSFVLFIVFLGTVFLYLDIGLTNVWAEELVNDKNITFIKEVENKPFYQRPIFYGIVTVGVTIVVLSICGWSMAPYSKANISPADGTQFPSGIVDSRSPFPFSEFYNSVFFESVNSSNLDGGTIVNSKVISSVGQYFGTVVEFINTVFEPVLTYLSNDPNAGLAVVTYNIGSTVWQPQLIFFVSKALVSVLTSSDIFYLWNFYDEARLVLGVTSELVQSRFFDLFSVVKSPQNVRAYEVIHNLANTAAFDHQSIDPVLKAYDTFLEGSRRDLLVRYRAYLFSRASRVSEGTLTIGLDFQNQLIFLNEVLSYLSTYNDFISEFRNLLVTDDLDSYITGYSELDKLAEEVEQMSSDLKSFLVLGDTVLVKIVSLDLQDYANLPLPKRLNLLES